MLKNGNVDCLPNSQAQTDRCNLLINSIVFNLARAHLLAVLLCNRFCNYLCYVRSEHIENLLFKARGPK